MLPIPLSPQPLKIPLFTVFSSIFPCANAGSQLQHIYKKSFQNIVFDSVFPMFPVKQTVIYTFFAIKAVNPSKTLLFDSVFGNVSSQAYGNLHVFCYNVSPKHLFLQCFQCSGIQKPCKILLCTMFFSFLAVFPLPESYQNDPKFHFNTLLRSDTQKSSKNVENTTVFWSRCETVFGPPPPPAKADIATAILTNVIEHLVLLLPPNKHAFTAKAVWADFCA